MKPVDPTVSDDIFEALVCGYDAVPVGQTEPFLARLCLLLGQAVGEPVTVNEAVKQARESKLTSVNTKEFLV